MQDSRSHIKAINEVKEDTNNETHPGEIYLD